MSADDLVIALVQVALVLSLGKIIWSPIMRFRSRTSCRSCGYPTLRNWRAKCPECGTMIGQVTMLQPRDILLACLLALCIGVLLAAQVAPRLIARLFPDSLLTATAPIRDPNSGDAMGRFLTALHKEALQRAWGLPPQLSERDWARLVQRELAWLDQQRPICILVNDGLHTSSNLQISLPRTWGKAYDLRVRVSQGDDVLLEESVWSTMQPTDTPEPGRISSYLRVMPGALWHEARDSNGALLRIDVVVGRSWGLTMPAEQSSHEVLVVWTKIVP